MVKRKLGTLLPNEISILAAVERLGRAGVSEPHGFAIALKMRERPEALRLTWHGTLYRALERLETAGLLRSRLEYPVVTDRENRPVSRLYTIMQDGLKAHAQARAPAGREARQLEERTSET